jgi:uncharacterized damage-inducible protein DinB
VLHSEIRRTRGAAPLVFAFVVALPAMAWAQQQQARPDAPVFDAKGAAHIRDAYLADLDTVHVKIMALANAIPADKYSWRPTAGVRSVSEALMHVASEWWFFGPRSVGGKEPADFGAPKEKLPALEKITSKAEVIDQLNKSWAHIAQQLEAADPAQLTGKYKPWGLTIDAAAFIMAGDLHEHLGQLIAYSRSVGVKPPWSK